MNKAEKIKSMLLTDVDAMASAPETFAARPGRDFTRHRKFYTRDILLFPILMKQDTINRELDKYFDFSLDVPSMSAYYQQRSKLKDDTFRQLFDTFNSHFEYSLLKDKYIVLGVDGSGFNLFRDPSQENTFILPNKTSPGGHNEMHVTAAFSITDRIFTDAVIQPSPQKNEYKAICQIVDNAHFDEGIPLFLADRGFPSYNFFAHCKEKGASFLVRAKELYIERLLKDDMPDSEEFDITVERILTRSSSKKKRSRPDHPELYRKVYSNTAFDYLSVGSADEYTLSLRVLRIKITDDSYEYLITNLPVDEFDIAELRLLYYLRWGIETSFRELKHAVGAQNFHARMFKYVIHETWARLILYNFCSRITAVAVVRQSSKRKYTYQVNYSMAIKNCHDFLRQGTDEVPMDIIGLIEKYTLPVRPGRNYARQHRFQTPLKFTYRN